jgi:phosphatidylserine/phosphatidylglycerophosphate/cardiolipin synthase-like enzyme
VTSPVHIAAACLLLVSVAVAGPAVGHRSSTPVNGTGTSVGFAAVYPNPLVDEDRGEFVVVDAPTDTALGNYTLSDGESNVSLPNTTVGGRVALSAAPTVTRNRTDARVLEVDLPALANGGENLTLTRNGRPVATLSYADATEGERGRATGGGVDWQPLGATDLPVVTGGSGTVRAFVLPDAPAVPRETLAAADDHILLAGYTLTSRRVVGSLTNASERGVDVRVLVDGAPVGGLTRREATALDRLVAANVSVRILGGDRARYDFHHAKYAVVDDRALVTTENWKPAGTGGHGSRGWGVVVHQQAVVDGLAETFRADAGWRDARRWGAVRESASFEPADGPPANATYGTQFEPRRVRAEHVELVVAPDNAERRVVALLDDATRSIRVQQVSIGDRRQSFLRATLRAARRGVDVRILLSSAWYVEEENRRLVAWLNDRAAREDLPLEAKLADPRGRYEKIHAKGVIVDGDSVVVGSLNWNNNSARENREVALVLHGEAVGDYYGNVFEADWQGGTRRLPVGLAAAVLLAGTLAVLAGRRIEFEEGSETGVRPGERRL